MGWAVSTELVDIALIVCYNFFDELQLSLFYIIIAIFEIGGLVMKTKQFLITACMLLLLCACQSPANTEDTANDLPPENVEIETPASDSPTEEEPDALLPPAPPVCEVAFTETESFPLPFEEELLVDEEEGILLSAGQALYDYDTMWALLEENYPYFDVIKEELGISNRVVKTRYRAKLVSLADDGYISQEAFINTITYCLYEFRSIGHLSVIPPAFRDDMQSWLSNSNNIFYANLLNIVNNPVTDQFYQYWSHALENPFPSRIAYSNVTKDMDIVTAGFVDDIPYLKITTFSSWTDETYTIVKNFLLEIRDAEDLIIDIQGNGGGDSNAWYWGIVPKLITEGTPIHMLLGMKTGALNLALTKGDTEYWSCFQLYENEEWQKDFPYITPDRMQGMDLLVKDTRVIRPDTNAQSHFCGKIWVLIDEKCYSAADQFAYFCKETGFATLVGTTTRGNGIGLQPYVMALPYSGLLVYYDPFLSFNPDGTCNGIVGTRPDIAPDTGQTALEACVAAIQHQ